MSLAEQKQWWDAAAIDDAEKAVLTRDEKWDHEDFYATGHHWVESCRDFARLSLVDLKGSTALDFGCGLGRTANAWKKYFPKTVGIDISEEMIARAKERVEGVDFQVVEAYPLPFADKTFDLVFSTIVIQHISWPHNLIYCGELMRVLKSGCHAILDAPSSSIGTSLAGLGLYLLPVESVVQCAKMNNCDLIALRDFQATPTRHYQYIFRKHH